MRLITNDDSLSTYETSRKHVGNVKEYQIAH